MRYWWVGWLVIMLSLTAKAHYAEDMDALVLMHELAEEYDYNEAYLQSLLMAVSKDDEVLRKISIPAEKTKEWHEYRRIFLDKERIEKGVAFWQANAETLARAEKEFGVDAGIIVGILGVETRYGKVTGTTPVFQALATLCFDYPERAVFFCDQLDYMLRLSRAQDFNPLSIKGSYAGAMGMAQFMPSSYVNDAIDYDGDGKIDLFHSTADAIGSIANYLAKRGWQPNGQYRYRLPVKPAIETFGQDHFAYIDKSDLQADDNLKNDENVMKWLADLPEENVGSLILQGDSGEQWWITYHNFGVITRYNTSPLYAMAVIDLANEISKKTNSE
ncbi:MAG: lytic murein transglycosylase B [Cardiobacteriales bacterium]|nr:MAG: lytic murein transglycosylase B [Cardiobacteriales bacterium]